MRERRLVETGKLPEVEAPGRLAAAGLLPVEEEQDWAEPDPEQDWAEPDPERELESEQDQDWEELPPVDERLIMPGTRYEVIDGRVVYVPPADPLHGEAHSRLQTLLETHVEATYQVACDVLMRTSRWNDLAPDASVYPREPDPVTGRRQLEELVFEVVNKSGMVQAALRAQRFSGRGVRRVFAIDVRRRRVLEWSEEDELWCPLAPDAQIVDRALAVPLTVSALLGVESTHDAVVRALLQRGNELVSEAVQAATARHREDWLAAGKLEGLAAGKLEGLAAGKLEGLAAGKLEGQLEGQLEALRTALLQLLSDRGFTLSSEVTQRVASCRDRATLLAWISRAGATASPEALLF